MSEVTVLWYGLHFCLHTSLAQLSEQRLNTLRRSPSSSYSYSLMPFFLIIVAACKYVELWENKVVIYWGSEMRFISWGSKKRLCFQHKSHRSSDQSAKYQKVSQHFTTADKSPTHPAELNPIKPQQQNIKRTQNVLFQTVTLNNLDHKCKAFKFGMQLILQSFTMHVTENLIVHLFFKWVDTFKTKKLLHN